MVEWIVSSSVLIAILILLRFVLKGKISLRLQYALWALVLVRLLVPVSFGQLQWSAAGAAELLAPVERTIDSSELVLPINEYYEFESMDAYDSFAESNKSTNILGHKNPELTQLGSSVHGVWALIPMTVPWRTVLHAVWILGAAITGTWFLLSNLRLLRSLKRTRTLLPGDCELPVYLSNAVDTPCLFGLFYPAIYLTSEAAENENTLRHAVEHELTHYHHKDNIWAILRCVCLAIHWFNPLVWYAAVLSRNDAELACDESTILRLGEGERAAYGRTLISLTCEKRPALLNTATTMTGSGKSIKERIALIVKKPKMAGCTLVAVILITTVAVGCTFTGAKEQPASFEEWTSSLTGDAIEWAEMAKGYGIEKISYTVPESEFDDLSTLLGTITDENCSRKNPEAGNEDGYRLALYRDDKLWLFKCLADGTIGLMFNDAETGAYYGSEGKLLIIEHPELWEYIVSTVDERGISDTSIPIGISDIDINTVPGAVISYAEDYVRQQIDYHNELGNNPLDGMGEYTITAAMITKLEQVNTGTAGLNDGVALYLLEYRLLADHPENILMAGGMSVESGWLTEHNSAGQPYLLLHHEGNGSETVWTPICVTNTDAIEVDYGTPEMLDEYGNAYTAAALELYNEYKAHQRGEEYSNHGDSPSAPAEAIYALFDAAGDMTITLYLANEGACSAYTVTEHWYAERFEVLMMSYEWTEIEMSGTMPSDYWLTAESSNGVNKMTFWSGNAGMIQYDNGSTTTYWTATPLYDSSTSIAYDIRREYDNLDVDYSRIKFYLEGDAEKAAEAFVRNAYGSHLMSSLAPGNGSRIVEYDVVNWGVQELSEDGAAVVGWLEYAFVPENMDSPDIWAGNTVHGTGEYEGMLTAYREFVLQKQDDGYWHCIGLGTGGYTLPE